MLPLLVPVIGEYAPHVPPFTLYLHSNVNVFVLAPKLALKKFPFNVAFTVLDVVESLSNDIEVIAHFI